jgi:GNAT superfamily N-acetyltransferase
MSTELSPRIATTNDRDRVVEIIAEAFADDPLWSHALALPGGGKEHHALFWTLLIDGALRYPWVWLTEDADAVSIWIPPGGTETSDEQEEQLMALAYDCLGAGAADYLDLLERFGVAHPRGEPHYYLSLLGVASASRGRGIGMSLLRHDLSLIDEEGMPAYLESSNPANNLRYENVGFEPVGRFSYPRNGPVVTTMWRRQGGRGTA